MIGNDLPALDYTFSKYGIGKCVKTLSKEYIESTIMKIEQHYNDYQERAKSFFNSIDMKKAVNDIVVDAFQQNNSLK